MSGGGWGGGGVWHRARKSIHCALGLLGGDGGTR